MTGAVSPIPAADLPLATEVATGAVSVPAAGGLAVSGTGQISIGYTTTAAIVANVAYNEFGQIIYVTDIEPGHLPVATQDTIGAVKVPLNQGLLVDGDGNVTLSDTGVAAGTYTKVAVDQQGRVTNGGQIVPSDIPKLDASVINSGTFPGARIGDREIEEIKLADYSTCLIQEGQPTGDFKLGQLWFTPSTNQLRIFGRGSGGSTDGLWLSVGFGALQSQNLRWGGTVNATTSTITTLTDIGISEGLTAGGPLPTPTDELSGLYFVVQEGGNGITIPNVNGDALTPGDWVLYIDQAQGAVALDISAGSGGGGGATDLEDLLDVNITTLVDDQFLQYDAISGMWVNVSLISGGTY